MAVTTRPAKRLIASKLTALVLLAGCASDDPLPEPTRAVPPSSAAATASTTTLDSGPVQAVIEIDGGQLLGLAADATAVWPVSFDAGTISKVDPETDEVVSAVALGPGAASALAVDGVLWVAGYGGDPSLSKVDAATATLASTHPVGELCCDLSSGDGSLWAVDPGGFVVEIDLATGESVQRIPITIDRNAHTNAVYADGHVWFSSDTTPLSRLDPESGMIDQFDVGGGVPFLARDGLVWGASPTEVWAVDSGGAVVEHVELTNSMEVMSLELSGPDLWVGMRKGGRIGVVRQIERATGSVNQEIEVDIPARMVVGFGSLWVTDSGSNKLYRIGPID